MNDPPDDDWFAPLYPPTTITWLSPAPRRIDGVSFFAGIVAALLVAGLLLAFWALLR